MTVLDASPRSADTRIHEVVGDLWTTPYAKVIPTNGVYAIKSGRPVAVMGKGVALDAKRRYPGIDDTLGTLLRRDGNHTHLIWSHGDRSDWVFSFPTKRHWSVPSELSLIERSARELVQLVDALNLPNVVLPRVGCGEGKLRWDDVQPLLAEILDERFWIVSRE